MTQQKKVYRSTTDRKITGVCGGLAEYFNIDPVIVRIVFLFLLFCAGGGLIAYLLCTIIMPER